MATGICWLWTKMGGHFIPERSGRQKALQFSNRQGISGHSVSWRLMAESVVVTSWSWFSLSVGNVIAIASPAEFIHSSCCSDVCLLPIIQPSNYPTIPFFCLPTSSHLSPFSRVTSSSISYSIPDFFMLIIFTPLNCIAKSSSGLFNWGTHPFFHPIHL